MQKITKLIGGVALAVTAVSGLSQQADACSRILYEGTDSLYVVARSLDWKTPIPTNLYVYPQGMHKVGSNEPGAVEWTSKYGAVYAVGYDGGIKRDLQYSNTK